MNWHNIYQSVKIGLFLLLFLLVTFITGTGCASDRKAREIIKRTENSSCDLAHMGRNKYYYSPHYKRRLSSNIRALKRRK